MRFLFKNLILSALSFTCLSFNCIEAGEIGNKKYNMLSDIETIKHALEVHYAPAEWKKKYANWDINQAWEKAKMEILNQENITIKEFQQIVRRFLGSTQDYHVQVYFLSTEGANLPFGVKSVNG